MFLFAATDRILTFRGHYDSVFWLGRCVENESQLKTGIIRDDGRLSRNGLLNRTTTTPKQF